MTTLRLRLAGPLQSWGASSRFVRRATDPAPTKSGVIGMLAAARGLRRTDPITELLGLRFAVRVDQPGRLVRDFQTARSLDGGHAYPLSYRYYLADAVFLAVIEGDDALIRSLDEAVRSPHYPLYLGRRSCPPAGPVSLGSHPGGLADAVTETDWQASEPRQRQTRSGTVTVEVVRDARPDEAGAETVRDEPVSFDPRRREYGWRAVVRERATLPNLYPPAMADHDPFAAVGG